MSKSPTPPCLGGGPRKNMLQVQRAREAAAKREEKLQRKRAARARKKLRQQGINPDGR